MKYIFSGALLRFVDFEKEVLIEENDFDSAMESLMKKFPTLRGALLDNEGNFRKTHQIFLNGDHLDKKYYSDVGLRKTLQVKENDTAYILTAIAGG